MLTELLFSLPASNGKLEQVFSLLGTVKVNKRLWSLDDLILSKSDKIPLASFNADPSIDLWWSAKARRPTHKKREWHMDNAAVLVDTHQHLEQETPVKRANLRTMTCLDTGTR